jgi:hypothetical protein
MNISRAIIDDLGLLISDDGYDGKKVRGTRGYGYTGDDVFVYYMSIHTLGVPTCRIAFNGNYMPALIYTMKHGI